MAVNPFDNVNNQTNVSNKYYQSQKTTNEKAGNSLDMTDFLSLMVASFQNQSIDDPADTSDMMNQMVQMSVIQAITDISKLISDSTNMTYAASLIGQEVTIGVYNDSMTDLTEIVGVVTGTGQLNGEQVIFIGDDTYKVSDILGVGRMPSTDDDDDKTGSTGSTESTGSTGSTGSTESTDTTDRTEDVQGSGSAADPAEDNTEVDENEALEQNGADIDPTE